MVGDDDGPDDDQQPDGQPPQYDAGEPAAVRKRETKAQLRQRKADEWWGRLLDDPVGRREVFGILAECHTFEERFACGPNGFPQSEATWFEAGRQSVGLRLFQTLFMRHPMNAMLMLSENDARFVRFAPKDV